MTKNSIYPITQFKKNKKSISNDLKNENSKNDIPIEIEKKDANLKDKEILEAKIIKSTGKKPENLINKNEFAESLKVSLPIEPTEPTEQTEPIEKKEIVETIPKPEKRHYKKREPKINNVINPKDSINEIKDNNLKDIIQNEPLSKREKFFAPISAKTTIQSLNMILPNLLSFFDSDIKKHKDLLLLNNNEINMLEQPTQNFIDYYDLKLHPAIVLAIMFGGIYTQKIIEIKKLSNNG